MSSAMQSPVRLGHAVRSESGDGDDALSMALGLLEGSRLLTSRTPANPDAVCRAEQILGADPRPIYAFIGLLHPQLGTVGLTYMGAVERGEVNISLKNMEKIAASLEITASKLLREAEKEPP